LKWTPTNRLERERKKKVRNPLPSDYVIVEYFKVNLDSIMP